MANQLPPSSLLINWISHITRFWLQIVTNELYEATTKHRRKLTKHSIRHPASSPTLPHALIAPFTRNKCSRTNKLCMKARISSARLYNNVGILTDFLLMDMRVKNYSLDSNCPFAKNFRSRHTYALTSALINSPTIIPIVKYPNK